MYKDTTNFRGKSSKLLKISSPENFKVSVLRFSGFIGSVVIRLFVFSNLGYFKKILWQIFVFDSLLYVPVLHLSPVPVPLVYL